MNLNELRNKTVDELHTEGVAMQRELFNLRMQKVANQSVQTHLFRKARRQVARIKTVIREKEGNS